MIDKLKSKILDIIQKLYVMSPFAAGIAIGYVTKPILRFLINFGIVVVRHIIG